MNGRTTSIVALLTLALGGGVGFLKFVSPAMAERTKLTAQKNDLTSQADALNKEVAELQHALNGLVLGSIAYFDLTNEPNKRRVMEAKTIETLASLTEILNDNHLRVVTLDPQGESQGLNRPIPTTPAPTLAPGQSPPPAGPAGVASASPTPVPGSTTPPPPVSLTHKAFNLKLEGEYPNYVKALTEFEALPRAISINAFKVKLVHDNSMKGQSAMQNAGLEKGGTQPSQSLLALDMDLSITFVMDSGNAAAPLPSQAPAASPSQHAGGLVARAGAGEGPLELAGTLWRPLDAWLCPPAAAAELHPRTLAHAPKAGAPRPYNTLKAVSFEGGALRLHTTSGKTPTFRVVGSHAGFLMLELDRTLATGVTTYPVTAPGVGQVLLLPAPGRPGAAHLAITGAPGTRLRAVMGPDQVLRVLVESPEAIARAHFGPPPAASATPRPGAFVARPKDVKFKSVALLPAHQAAHMTARAATATTTVTAAPPATHLVQLPAPRPTPSPSVVAGNPPALQVLVTPRGVEPPATLPERQPGETAAAWQHRQVVAAAAASGPLHGAPMLPAGAMQALVLPPRPDASAPVTIPAPLPHPALAHRPPAARPVPARPALPTRVGYTADELTHLDGARVVGGELRIETHGAPADFHVMGGNRSLLLLTADHLPLPGRGRLLAVGTAGIKQVRAVLYDGHSLTAHLAIDTDGSVRLVPVGEENGVLRLRITPIAGGTQPLATVQRAVTADATTNAITTTLDVPLAGLLPAHKPPAKSPPLAVPPKGLASRLVPRPRSLPPRLPAAVPLTSTSYAHPSATPTPMAVPARPLQLAAGAHGPSPRPTSLPAWATGAAPLKPMATPRPHSPFDGHSLNPRPDSGSYRFPIDRSRVTGRRNPFAPLPNPLVTPTPGPVDKPGLPKLPAVPSGAPAAAPIGHAPSVSHQYHLKAVMIGGGYPPSALVLVDGKTVLVGLKQGLPGNAKVKSIKSDAVILSANGQELHLHLER